MRARRWLGVAAVAGAAVVACTVPVAHAQEAAPDPAREVLAIVSPVASPVCSASGLSTLLVPIVGGVVEEQLALGDTVSVGDLILDAMGPAFIVCGELPANDGTRCALVDDQIVAVWPEQIGDLYGAPPLGGNTVEALGRALVVLGLEPLDALEEPLHCSIPDGASTPEAPPAPPALGAAPPAVVDDSSDPEPPRPASPSGGVAGPSVGAPVVTSGAAVSTTPSQPASVPQTIVDIAFRQVSGAVRLLQLLVALALAAFLLATWRRSWQLAHGASE